MPFLFLRVARLASCNNSRRFVYTSIISRHATPAVSLPAATGRNAVVTYHHPIQRNLSNGPDLKSFMPTRGLPPKRGIPNVQHVVAVSSAKGGVGKSTVAGTQCQTLYSVLLPNGLTYMPPQSIWPCLWRYILPARALASSTWTSLVPRYQNSWASKTSKASLFPLVRSPLASPFLTRRFFW